MGRHRCGGDFVIDRAQGSRRETLDLATSADSQGMGAYRRQTSGRGVKPEQRSCLAEMTFNIVRG